MEKLSEQELLLVMHLFLFKGVSRAAIWATVSDKGCQVETFPKGTDIFTPKEYTRALGVILSGKVRVSKGGFLVSTLEAGDLFGAAALFNSEREYATTLTARSPCKVVFFSQKLVKYTMAYHPEVAGNYIRYLSGRVRFLEGKLDEVLTPGAEGKLGQYLLAHREGDAVVLPCPMNALAQRLDVSRASLYRAFEQLEKAGVIEKDGKTVRILKEEL